MELTIEQKRALATAAARKRLQQNQPAAAPAPERSWGDWLLGRNLPPEKQAEVDAWRKRIVAPAEGPNGAINMLQGMTSNYADDAARMVGATGFADRINREQEQFRQSHPVGSMLAEGLGAGVQAVAGGGLLGKVAPKAAAFLNPAGRGGLARAGRYAAVAAPQSALAASGEEDATLGSVVGAGLTGAAIGGAIPVVGNMARRGAQAVSNKLADKAALKAMAAARAKTPAMSSDELGQQADTLFDALRKSGAKLPSAQAAAAKADIDAILGQTTKGLAKNSFAAKKVIDRVLGQGDVDVLDWHNLSKEINIVARDPKLEYNDARVIGLIKRRIDALRDGPVSGSKTAMTAWKAANELTLRKAKVEEIERALDIADLKTGQYTQAQIAHTVALKFRQLYEKYSARGADKLFSKEELAIMREIGKGNTSSKTVNLLKKLAPRGVVSAALGGMIGNATMGPAGVVIAPAIGEAAQRMANKQAMGAAERFMGDISRKMPPIKPNYRPIPKLSNTPLDMLLLPGGSGLATGISQR